MRDAAHWRPDTWLQHLGEEEHIKGAVVPPIFQNSLFVFERWDDFAESFAFSTKEDRRYTYSRIANPTQEVAEQKIARLEGMDHAKLFTSGMAAISAAIFSCVESGSHVVCVDTVYGPTRQLLLDYLPRFGVKTTLVGGRCTDELLGAIQPETTLVVLESPSSLLFRCQDLETIGRVCREKGVTTMIDNTYSSPLYQQPAKYGIDLVVHSATKFLSGHSDVVAGVVCASRERMMKLFQDEVPLFGAALPPFPAWLITRGMRTLSIRMKASQEAGSHVAGWLEHRPEVDEIFHLGLTSYPQRALVEKQMSGTVGLFSFVPKFQDKETVKRFVEALDLFQMGVSWGGHESLAVALPLQPLDWPEKRWVIRLYCGLEDPRDLVADLEQAFAQL